MTPTFLLVIVNVLVSIAIALLSVIVWFGKSRFDGLEFKMVAQDIKINSVASAHNECKAGLAKEYANRKEVDTGMQKLWEATNGNSTAIARMQGSCKVGAE